MRQLLIGGLSEINVDDWQKHTLYKTYSALSPVIVFFWRFIREADNEMRARVLQFVTGTSRVPTTGFKDLWGTAPVCSVACALTSLQGATGRAGSASSSTGLCAVCPGVTLGAFFSFLGIYLGYLI